MAATIRDVMFKALKGQTFKVRVLTPCDPRKECKVCEARLNRQLGPTVPKVAKWRHQAEDAGRRAIPLMFARTNDAVKLVMRAATYANMVLGPYHDVEMR